MLFRSGARNALEKAIQRQTQPQTQPLADTAWFRRGMTALPADAGAGSVENVNLRLTHLWTAVKSGKLFGLIEIGFADDETLKPFLEVLSLLPEYEKVQRHFGINTGWVRMRPDGFLMEMIDIPAPESSN